MAINFDSLPQDNPFALPERGLYRATIVEASMKQGQDLSKPMYLNIKYNLFDKQGNNKGTLYDIISESDSSVVQYKIGRFIRACGIPLVGSMELKDLAKIVVNKSIALDVGIDEKDPAKPRAQVDLFTREAYYLPDEFDSVYNLLHPESAEAADFEPADPNTVPFTAQDSAPATEQEY